MVDGCGCGDCMIVAVVERCDDMIMIVVSLSVLFAITGEL